MANTEKKLNKLGLLNSLITVINEGKENSSDVIIAKYLLENYEHLHELNIYDIAENCYVDRATIRRNAKKLGFANFKDLKNEVTDFSDFPFYKTGIGDDLSEGSVMNQITNMVTECDQFFEKEKIDRIVDDMRNSSQIVFLTFDVYSRQSSEFQKAMILNGKMVRIISSKFEDNDILKNLKSNDMLIVISMSGYFVTQIAPLIHDNAAKKILLTTVVDEENSCYFEEIWQLSKKPRIDKRSVYTMFATQYCLEKLFGAYVKKYNKSKD